MTLPEDFVNQIKTVLPESYQEFLDALHSSPETSVRFNDKTSDIHLQNQNLVPWCDNAFYLEERPNFTLDPLLHAGAYYVQEASSMFVYQALKQYVDPSSLVVDMCAAPGGKSTLISQYLNKDGFLISNEYVSQRAHILSENLTKWGNVNGLVTNNAPEHFEFLSQMFDAVLVDAPCSGEGMFRKDERAISEWSLANVDMCVERQRTILESAVEILKQDGILIYSTCTYNTKENEENVQWLIDEMGMEYCPLETSDGWNIITTDLGYRFMPHKTKGEGLFLAVLRKVDSSGRNYKPKKSKTKFAEENSLTKWLADSKEYQTIVRDSIVYGVQKTRHQFICEVLERLNVFTFGIPLATIKGKSQIPHPALALSKALNRDAFVVEEVDEHTALTFLKTEALSLPDTPTGFVLITYKLLALGWVKNIGNRCNNLYPSNWRIRMSIH